MEVRPPKVLLDILGRFDVRTDLFDTGDVTRDLAKATKEMNCEDVAERKSVWAESAPWEFDTHRTADGGPWKTYFQPWLLTSNEAGEYQAAPDLRNATPEVITYWAVRAEGVRHPVLKARYADLVWDTTKFVSGGKPAIKFAHMAIDSYLAASKLDGGSKEFYAREGLTRALQLAMSIGDNVRVDATVVAHIEFAERIAEDDCSRTCCCLFDNLLPPQKAPTKSPGTEKRIIGFLESNFAVMTTPGGEWDAEPHNAQQVGLRLAAYYQRTQREYDRIRILTVIARAFERRAKIIDAMIGMSDLDRARELYVDAGLREDAERVQREAQQMGPLVEKGMFTTSVKHEIPGEHIERFKADLTERGLEGAIDWLARSFVPDQERLAKHATEMAKKYPMQAIFKPVLLGHGHITADVGDEKGDPDGEAVWRTSQHLRLQIIWISWGFQHLVEAMDFNADHAASFVARCQLFEEDRLPLIRAGVQAYLDEDYIKAVHVLVPQIEKALVNLFEHVGKATNKAHRSGRGVMQFKNINDVLGDDLVSKVLGPNLRVYLLATLAHSKGLNIRHEVCHGLWSSDQFTRIAAEQVLHVLFAVSLGRANPSANEDGTGVPGEVGSDPE